MPARLKSRPVADPRKRAVSRGLMGRLRKVRLLLCDVDGVLTDGGVYLGQGVEFKRFDIQDGLGLVMLRKNGFVVGWVSSRKSGATSERAADLKIDYLIQDKGPKALLIEKLLARIGLSWDQVCYVGDDIVDLGPLGRAGFAVAVANAREEVRAVAHYVTRASGGRGAVREISDLLLFAQGKWAGIVAEHAA